MPAAMGAGWSRRLIGGRWAATVVAEAAAVARHVTTVRRRPATDWERSSRLVAASATEGQALLSDDAALGLSEHHCPRAVLLLEPVNAQMVRDPATGRRCDPLAELLVLRGFHRLFVETPLPYPGSRWTLHRDLRRLELRDHAGNVWARPTVAPDPRWLVAAADHGYALVLFGGWLGVRAPQGVHERQYGPQQRAAELREGRKRGLVAAAAVHWRA